MERRSLLKPTRMTVQYEYKRDVPPALLKGNAVLVEFHLDKSMLPSGNDARELGVVARSVGLESK